MLTTLFTTFIVQPIFNLLVLIYNIIPGHNFGMAIILFTIVVRILLWPFVKKQLHQTKLMRQLQPELKAIKKKANGDKRQEALMMMELYKERGVSMFASFRMLLIQLPILLGLYAGLTRVLKDPQQLIDFSYPWIQDFSWMQELAQDISKFDETLFGIVDLTRPALDSAGVYWPAMLLVIGSAAIQYLQSKQLLPRDKEARSLRQILKDAGEGKQADQSEVSAAVGKNTIYLFPALIFMFTVNLASALSLYWLVSGLVAYLQQYIALREDAEEMDSLADRVKKVKSSAGKKSEKSTASGDNVASEADDVSGDRSKKNDSKKPEKSAAKPGKEADGVTAGATGTGSTAGKRRYGSKTARGRAAMRAADAASATTSAGTSANAGARREQQAVEAEVVSIRPRPNPKPAKQRTSKKPKGKKRRK